MNVAVVTFPGSNCDQDCFRAVELAGAEPRYVWHRERSLGNADAVILPGGFAHGDYLRPGAIARFSPIMDAVAAFAADGGVVAGICNGFQVLCEAGPAARRSPAQPVAPLPVPRLLSAGRALRHAFHQGVPTRPSAPNAPLPRRRRLPAPSPAVLQALEAEGCVAFRYCDRNGDASAEVNPNGSLNHVAGIVNARGNVLGMMPHPDRALEEILGSADGLSFFESLTKGPAGRPRANGAAPGSGKASASGTASAPGATAASGAASP